MRRIAIVLALLMTAACTADGSAKALKDAGYTNVTITGYRWFGCGDDDDFHTGFTATGPTGRPVAGVVCSGFTKGHTIRLD